MNLLTTALHAAFDALHNGIDFDHKCCHKATKVMHKYISNYPKP